ncbi:hypothetical protein OK290_04250, partial [Streptococcus pneumoniae]|nr:hypothetical protein [Streptococcus pneumoniae]MDG7617491.1 hypothetical protein [Streptococcus pneumoniae]MDG8911336.1 hypothetical protein [Streptococcus pneumoniae]
MVNVKEYPLYFFSYSMEIKEQTRKLAAGCSKHCFEVVDRTDEVSNHIYGNVTLTWFEEIFEEYYISPQLFTPNLKTIQNPCLSLDPGWFLF